MKSAFLLSCPLMADEEEDRKVIAGDFPDPQEQIILEPMRDLTIQ